MLGPKGKGRQHEAKQFDAQCPGPSPRPGDCDICLTLEKLSDLSAQMEVLQGTVPQSGMDSLPSSKRDGKGKARASPVHTHVEDASSWGKARGNLPDSLGEGDRDEAS